MDNRKVIQALFEEKKILKKRLEAIDAALIGFGVNPESESDVVSKGFSEKPLKDASKEIDQKDYNQIDIPDEYTPFTSWPERIAFVLKDKKNGAVADEIAKEIIKLDPEQKENEDYVYRAVTQHSSRMYRNGDINAVRVGRKFRYRLKEIKEAS